MANGASAGGEVAYDGSVHAAAAVAIRRANTECTWLRSRWRSRYGQVSFCKHAAGVGDVDRPRVDNAGGTRQPREAEARRRRASPIHLILDPNAIGCELQRNGTPAKWSLVKKFGSTSIIGQQWQRTKNNRWRLMASRALGTGQCQTARSHRPQILGLWLGRYGCTCWCGDRKWV